jgi:hypothetical protein
MEDNKDIKPTPEQIKNYYEKGIEDGLTREQIADLFFADQAEAYAEVMGGMNDDIEKALNKARNFDSLDNYPDGGINPDPRDSGLNYFGDERPEKQIAYQDMPDSGEGFKPEYLDQEIEAKNNLPKGSISKLGAVLDPISEGLEAGLRAVGLGSIASWWIKAEAANFLAGILRAGEGGLAQAQLGQSAALMGEKEIVSQTEENILKTAGEIFAQNMKLSPGAWLETKYAESSLGKGKTPTQQGYEAVKNALKLGK